jgi:endonuclease/exonuclease/phosphatase family metal-dependent hydrolase
MLEHLVPPSIDKAGIDNGEHISVATANTHTSEMLQDSTGLVPFTEASVDVMLLQEVIRIDQSHIEETLESAGYGLAHYDEPSGLAIALRSDSIWSLKEGSASSEVIQKMSFLGSVAARYKLPASHCFRPRGMIFAELETEAGNRMTVATTHPIVPVRPRTRAKQLKVIRRVLEDPQYKGLDLVIGADWNHYPGPHRADKDLREETGLAEVVFDESTWPIRGSKHEWLGNIAAKVTCKRLEDFDGRLDGVLHRGNSVTYIGAEIMAIRSDHRAVKADYTVNNASHTVGI